MKTLTIEKKMKFGNRFKAQVIENGKVVFETPWRNNLVLNQGKDNAASNLICDLFKSCAVGTGSSTPAATQVGLDTEIVRSNTYLTGIGNCGTTVSSNVLTHTRTFDFPSEIATIVYSEVGWSNSNSSGNNLNTRGLFASPVTVNTGQSLRVIYNFTVTVTPNTARTLTAPITGWPSKQWTLTAFGNGIPAFSGINQPTIGGGDNVDYFTLDEPFKLISAGTTGLTPGTTYYANPSFTTQIQVRATAGGLNIGFSNGTVVINTNALAKEQRILFGLSSVNVDGTTNTSGFDAAGISAEPSSDSAYIALSPYTGTLPAFNSPLNASISANAFSKVVTLGAYTTGNYYRDKTVSFLPSDGGSNRSDWLWLFLIPTAAAWTNASYALRFNHRQEKLNTATLNVSIRFSYS